MKHPQLWKPIQKHIQNLFLHESAFLGMLTSLDGIKIKLMTIVLSSVMLVVI